MRVVHFYISNKASLIHLNLTYPMLEYDYSENEIVLCRQFTYDAEARIAMSALEQNGIRSIIDGEIFATLYPGNPSLAGLRLMVRRADLERALQIVDSLNLDGE